MVLGPIHERVKELIGLFMNLILLELEINFEGLGSTIWKRPEVGRGLEADLCFLFAADKLAAHVQAIAQVQRYRYRRKTPTFSPSPMIDTHLFAF